MPNADRIIDLFAEARAYPSGPERERFLTEVCGDDAGLREQIVTLIDAETGGRSVLFDRSVITRSEALATERVGERIGRYKLLENIGEGGCGVVYMAQQDEPVRRRVALKVIKLGMDTKSVIARFEAERQALAMMDHPNIAKVFDGGATETGRPYFVMELVRGTRITDFCDQHSLSIEERLHLFIAVCEAIQHAHLKGIIHRDIKPSNILVSRDDGKVVPKVIDFGIAKATEQTLTDKTIFTAFEQFIGTPAYMSPEQAERTNVDIDTRSDIYSLGVLLYELLTGHTPFDSKALTASGMHEVQRIIRESEPPKPSQRLSTLAGAELTTVAGRRLSEPPKLLHRVRGDLDWVAIKCLEKDRAHRYETASELAADLQRHLNNEPVLASPPSLAYRLRKLARRHRVTAITGGLALLLLMLALIGTTWGMLQASRSEKRAIAEQRNSARLLFNSLVSEARATRLSGQPGSRFESLDLLRRARQSAKELQLSGDSVRTMRNEATASMAGADFQLEESWTPYPADSNSVGFDESLAICAIANQNGDCSIRRTGTQVELHFLPGLGKPATVGLSPDARYVVIHHATNAVHVWDLGAPTPRRVFAEPGVFQALLRNSDLIAFGYLDGSIKVFSLPDGKELYRVGPTKLVREVQLAFHPSEPLIATSSYFGREVEIRDFRTGEVISSLPQQQNVSSVVWTPDGRLAVGFAEAKCVKIYQRDALQPEQTIDTLQAVTMIAFSKVNNMMAIRGWNDILEVYDLSTGARIMRIKPNSYGMPKFSADGLRLASAARGGQMRVFKVRPSTEYRQLARQGGSPGNLYWRCSLHREGRLLAVAMTDGIVFWDLAFGREVGFIPSPGSLHRVLFEPSGSLLVGTLNGLARWPITPLPDRSGVFEVGPPRQLPFPGPQQIAQSGDGQVIATAHRSVGVNLRKAGAWISRGDQSNAPINLEPGADILEVAVSSDARWVVTTTHSSAISKLWDAQTGEFLKLLAPWGTSCARFTKDSRWLILSGVAGQIYSTETWTPVRSSNAIALMPSPDNRLGAKLNEDGLSLVEILSGEEIANLGNFSSENLADMMFSPDGTRLLVLDHKQGVKVWDLRQTRESLSAMELDWNYPAFPPSPKAPEPVVTPIRLRMSDVKSPP